MNTDFTTLYMLGNDGNIREWSIAVKDFDIVIHHGVLNGAIQEVIEEVPEGKASRTREEQIMSRVASRISRRIDMGYTRNIEDAKTRPTNRLGLYKPMLAQQIKNVPKFDPDEGVFVQRKYDGNRCIIGNVGGDIIAYSRNGKPVPADLSHITDDLFLRDGEFIDGELYAHGEKLQTIVSWVKRTQDNTKKLKFHAYDLINSKPYDERLAQLEHMVGGETTEVVPTYTAWSIEEVNAYHKLFRDEGYEGTIVRWSDAGYEDGKRSKSLIKVKSWLDKEFKVIGIHESKDGWAILECDLEGKTFRVSAPGTIADKTNILKNKIEYLGRWVNVEYSMVTKDGIPFHPVAKYFRD